MFDLDKTFFLPKFYLIVQLPPTRDSIKMLDHLALFCGRSSDLVDNTFSLSGSVNAVWICVCLDFDCLPNKSAQWCNEGCNLLWDGFGRWNNGNWLPYKRGETRVSFNICTELSSASTDDIINICIICNIILQNDKIFYIF